MGKELGRKLVRDIIETLQDRIMKYCEACHCPRLSACQELEVWCLKAIEDILDEAIVGA